MKKMHALIICCMTFMVLLCSCSNNRESINPTGEPIDSISTVESTIDTESTTPESLPVGLEKIESISANIDLPNADHITEIKESEAKEENISVEETIEEKPQDSTSETMNEVENDLKEVAPEVKICCEYMDYLNKSPVEQQEYMNTFSSPMAFIEWCKAAEAEHASHVTVVEVSGDGIDISDYIP